MHPLGIATVSVVEFSRREDPTQHPVAPNDPELRSVWLPCLPGIGDRFRHPLAVVWMDVTIKILRPSDKRIGRNSEHRLEVPEPGISPGLNVQFPSHRLAGFHRQTKPLVASNQLLFCELALRDLLDKGKDQRG